MSGIPHFPVRIIRQVVKVLETPMRVYEEGELRRRAAKMREAFGWSAADCCCYVPVRCCAERLILRLLRQERCGAECMTAAELRLARQCGFSGAALRYAPLVPDAEGERLAQALGAGYVIDDPALRPGYVPSRVWLRVNPGGLLMYGGKALAQCRKSKFGMERQDAFLLAEYYCAQGAEVGFAIHLTENEPAVELYAAQTQLLLEWTRAFEEQTGRTLRLCDLGGGLGVARRREDEDVSAEAAAELVRQTAAGRDIQISAAPGVWLLAQSGTLLSRVVMLKQRERPLMLLDADCGGRIAPGNYRLVEILGKKTTDVRQLALTDVVGSGDLRDRIAERRVLPRAKCGDIALVYGIGADRLEIPAALLGCDGAFYRLTETEPFCVRATDNA